MGSPPHSRVLGHILALFVTVVWGTTLISSKILLRAFTPLEIMTFRFLIAWAVLFCLSPRLLRPQDFRSELPFAAAGVSGLTLYFLLENTALRYTLTGIALISLSGGESLELNPLGDLLTLGAALCWGAYGVCLEFASSSGLNQLQCTRKVFFWGLATLLPLLPILHPDYSLSRFSDPSMLFNILYLGLVASALCFVCWNKAMVLIGTVATNVYIYLTPVVTLIASALILGEPVRPQAIGAIFLILPGLWLSQRPTS